MSVIHDFGDVIERICALAFSIVGLLWILSSAVLKAHDVHKLISEDTLHKWMWRLLRPALIAFFVGISTAIILLADYLSLGGIISASMKSPFFVLAAVTIGFLLYALRRRRPFLYGSLEITVAFVSMIISIRASNIDDLTRALGIMGGVYIMVRGLDNLDRGLPMRWRGIWDILFSK